MSANTVNKRYRILEDLGVGAQGELYLARCIHGMPGVMPDEAVHVNKLSCHWSSEGKAWANFDNRAKALCGLDHRNIAAYIDHFPWRVGDNNWPTIVAKRPEGQSLQAMLKEPPCPTWAVVRRVILECIDALIYARDRGVSPHLFINPGNIFVAEDGRITIRDFDITSRVEDENDTTPTTASVSALGYMAPETDRSDSLDERADIYSLGLCAFECLTGRRPQDIAGKFGMTWGETPEVTDFVFDLPAFWLLSSDVRTVICKAIQTDKEQRFKTLEEMRDAVPGENSGRAEYRVLKGASDEYRLTDFIAKGGFGLVFKAVRLSDGSPVCVKRLLRSRNEEEDLNREAGILRSCKHDHIVSYVDIGKSAGDGHLYLVMEFLDGMPGAVLSKRIDSHPNGMDKTETLEMFRCFASALSYIHAPVSGQRKAIVHRDIKPSNLHAPVGRPSECKILDFGVACDVDVAAGADTAHGTPPYRAPELSKDPRSTPRTDVFSLGVCLYEALAGGVYLRESVSRNGKRQMLDMDRQPFLQCSALLEVVGKATSPDPRHRYSTADEMRLGILKAQGSTPPHFESPPIDPRPRRFVPYVVAVLGVAAVVLLAGWILHNRRGSEPLPITDPPPVYRPPAPRDDPETRARQRREQELRAMGEPFLAERESAK